MGALNPHVGHRVSALIDGQLPEAEAERVWAHVMTCPPCRRQVEQEGWTKTRLQGGPESSLCAPTSLRGALHAVESRAELRAEIVAELREELQAEIHAEVRRVERAVRRRATVAIVGVSSMSVAVVGLMAVTASPTERTEHIQQSVTNTVPSAATH